MASRSSPLTPASASRSNSRPSTEARVSSRLQSSERWRRRRPITSLTLCGIASGAVAGSPSVSPRRAAARSRRRTAGCPRSRRGPPGPARPDAAGAASSMKRATSASLEAGERERSRDRLASQLGERRSRADRRGRIDVAVGADDQEAAVAELAGDEPEQQQRGLVRGVQVVEHQHERLRGRDALQEGGQRSKSRKRAPSDSTRGAAGRSGRSVAQLGKELGHVGRPGAELGAQLSASVSRRYGAQRLHPRPVRGRAARLPAAADEHPRPARPAPVRSAPRRAGSCRSRARRRAGTGARGRRRRRRGRRRARPARARGRRTCRAESPLGSRSPGVRRREVERRVLGEYRPLELAQTLAGLDAELLDQRPARVLVGLQRVGLAVGAVEREHQLRPQALAVGVLGDQRLELARPPRRGAPSASFASISCSSAASAQVLQPGDLALRERLVGEVRQRRRRATAPAPPRASRRRAPGGPRRARSRPSATSRSKRWASRRSGSSSSS